MTFSVCIAHHNNNNNNNNNNHFIIISVDLAEHSGFTRAALKYIRNCKTVQIVIENRKTEINFEQNQRRCARG